MFSPFYNFTWGTGVLAIRTVVTIIEGVICGGVVAKLYEPGKPAAA
jgi:hypothetical protein